MAHFSAGFIVLGFSSWVQNGDATILTMAANVLQGPKLLGFGCGYIYKTIMWEHDNRYARVPTHPHAPHDVNIYPRP